MTNIEILQQALQAAKTRKTNADANLIKSKNNSDQAMQDMLIAKNTCQVDNANLSKKKSERETLEARRSSLSEILVSENDDENMSRNVEAELSEFDQIEVEIKNLMLEEANISNDLNVHTIDYEKKKEIFESANSDFFANEKEVTIANNEVENAQKAVNEQEEEEEKIRKVYNSSKRTSIDGRALVDSVPDEIFENKSDKEKIRKHDYSLNDEVTVKTSGYLPETMKITDFERSIVLADNQSVRSNINYSSANIDYWTLDSSFVDGHESEKKWYQQEYIAKGKPLTFNEARNILNDENNNNNLTDEQKEFIRKSFGICDSDIFLNKQGVLGTCNLLASAHGFDRQIVDNNVGIENYVKQNDDGTVTVTFKGLIDQTGKPKQYIIPNIEIATSYKSDNNVVGGSSDPDMAALEIAYQRYVKEVNDDNCKEDPIGVCQSQYSDFSLKNDKVLKLFTMSDTEYITDSNKVKSKFDQLFSNANSFLAIDSPYIVSFKSEETSDNNEKIVTNHAYTVKDFDPETRKVYLRNPWDPNKDVEIDYEKFLRLVKGVHYLK